MVEKIESGFAWVRARKKSACGSCTNKSHCSRINGENQMLVKVANALNAKKGDSVEFQLNSSFLLKCTFIIYVVPTLGLLTGALAADPLAHMIGMHPTMAMVVFTLAGFLGAMVLSRLLIQRKTDDERFLPIIERIV